VYAYLHKHGQALTEDVAVTLILEPFLSGLEAIHAQVRGGLLLWSGCGWFLGGRQAGADTVVCPGRHPRPGEAGRAGAGGARHELTHECKGS